MSQNRAIGKEGMDTVTGLRPAGVDPEGRLDSDAVRRTRRWMKGLCRMGKQLTISNPGRQHHTGDGGMMAARLT